MHKQLEAFLVLICFSSGALALDLPDFTDLINQTSPAVVKINVSATTNNRGAIPEIPEAYRDFLATTTPPVSNLLWAQDL